MSRAPRLWFVPCLLAWLAAGSAPIGAQEPPGEMKKEAEPKKDEAAPATSEPSFARDVAPMIAASCLGCHSPRSRNWDQHELDMTTFAGLTKGGVSGPVITAKDSAQSLLITRLNGDGVRRMPPGNNNNIGEAKIKQVAAWIDAGALLDAGKSDSAAISTYARTAEDARRDTLAGMSPEARDAETIKLGKTLYAASGIKEEPQTTSGAHFVLFGKLPEARAKATIDALEQQYNAMSGLLTNRGSTPLLEPGAKIAVLVFNESSPFAEFQQSTLQRKFETGQQSASRLEGAETFVAAVDPRAGQPEPEQPKGRRRPTKKDDSIAAGPDRSLVGLLVEELGVGLATKAGKAGKGDLRLISLGVGSYFASRVDPGSPTFLKLRRDALQAWRTGGPNSLTEALGSQGDESSLRALGFSLFDFLGSTPATRARLPLFVQGIFGQGQAKLDDVIGAVYGLKRDAFLNNWGSFLYARYNRLSR